MTPAPIRAATGNGTAVRSGFGSVRTTGVDGSSAGSRGYGRTATDVAGRRRRRVFVGEARSGGWSGSGGAVRVWLSGAVGAAAGDSTLRWGTPREGTPRSGVPLPPARGTRGPVTLGEPARRRRTRRGRSARTPRRSCRRRRGAQPRISGECLIMTTSTAPGRRCGALGDPPAKADTCCLERVTGRFAPLSGDDERQVSPPAVHPASSPC